MKPESKSILLDIMTGVLSAIITYTILSFFPFNVSFILMTPVPIIAGFIRGKNPKESLFAKVVIMNILYYVLIMAIMNGVFHLIIILAAAVIGTALGIYIRREFSMSKIKVLVFLTLFYIPVICLGFFGLPSYFDAMMWKKESVAAPEYKLLTLQGDTLMSSDYSNKVVVMDFWATWCEPCKKQFPVMEKIYKNYKGNEKVAFLVVNSNMRGDSFDKALKFINQNSYDLPFVNDIKSTTSTNFHVFALPTTIIIDKKGIIRLTHTGYEESEHLYTKFCEQIDYLIDNN
jgi:thiol-disulfide isomerase/thioredoxin